MKNKMGVMNLAPTFSHPLHSGEGRGEVLKGKGKTFSSFSSFKEKVGMRYYMAMFLLLSLTLGCDGDGPLKPGEFEDPAFAKCVKDRIDYAISIGLWQKDDPDIYNKVEMLECYGGGVKSLKGIENMPNMDDLSIVDNEIESLEPLRTLTKLTFLKLSNNKIRDLEPLSGLPVLGSLIIDDNYVEDISPLYGVSSLTMLWLSRNCIDISQLEEIEKRNSNLHFSETTKSSQDPEKCQ